jgi:hypothetical protein
MSELYRPSNRRLSVKLVPTFVDGRGATWLVYSPFSRPVYLLLMTVKAFSRQCLKNNSVRELQNYRKFWRLRPTNTSEFIVKMLYEGRNWMQLSPTGEILIVGECILLLYVISKILTLIPYSQLVLCVYTYTRFILYHLSDMFRLHRAIFRLWLRYDYSPHTDSLEHTQTTNIWQLSTGLLEKNFI